MRKTKVLIISPSEICYNPRLIKAADSFYEYGYDVIVWNAITGLASFELVQDFKNSKPWEIIDFDISKRTLSSKITWLIVSGIQFISKIVFKLHKKPTCGFRFIRNKAFIGFTLPLVPDIIYVNLVDTLPLAAKLIKSNNCKLIYDSQEFFTGQFSAGASETLLWITQAEKLYIGYCSFILATTRVMADKIEELYSPPCPVLRVRNVPYLYQGYMKNISNIKDDSSLQLIWHGFAIYLNSRGVNVLLEAISKCTTSVKLTLQGKISSSERAKIELFLKERNALDRVFFTPPAHPEKIVQSLIQYDVGLIGELPIDQNQLFTSSNKLFEYLHAGLAVISSDMPGLIETINESKAGKIYNAGNANQLSALIDKLNTNRNDLRIFRENARQFSLNNYWKNDFCALLTQL